MEIKIDIETLRADLMDYYGSAMPYYPQAVIDLGRIENARPEELINIARYNGFNLEDYEVEKGRKF